MYCSLNIPGNALFWDWNENLTYFTQHNILKVHLCCLIIQNYLIFEGLCVLVIQLCPALCDSMDYILPGLSLHGISQARILEWVANFQTNPKKHAFLLIWLFQNTIYFSLYLHILTISLSSCFQIFIVPPHCYLLFFFLQSGLCQVP